MQRQKDKMDGKRKRRGKVEESKGDEREIWRDKGVKEREGHERRVKIDRGRKRGERAKVVIYTEKKTKLTKREGER